MAKNKTKAIKKKPVQRQKAKAKKAGGAPGWHKQMVLTFGVVIAAIFMPTSIVLLAGMLPTLVAVFVDRTKEKSSAITVGAMNFAGCAPFLLQLWSQGQTFDTAMIILSNPTSIVVMYIAAGVGYVIDWSITGLVASVVYQKGVARVKAIRKEQEELIDRWGHEVSGEVKLDKRGFAVDEDAHMRVREE